MIRSLIVTAAVAGLFWIFYPASAAENANHDIVDTATSAGTFTTLVRAIETAGLAEVLKSPGPFTVFAPTDEAFAALPKGTVEALLKDKQKLATVLTYHIVPGQVMAADVVKLESAKSAQGEWLTIKVQNDGVRVNDAVVLKTDLACSNGVIHVIDAVLLPSKSTPAAVTRAKVALQMAEAIEPAEQIAEFKRAAAEVLQFAPTNVLVKQALEDALSLASDLENDEAALLALREGLRDSVEILEFTPFQEAKLPQGFPELTPVGEIQVKTYPEYRMARVEMKERSEEGRAFFTLFQHIVRNRIEMTAPVESTYGEGPKRETAMAFLYESTDIGALGESGNVQVSNVPPMMAVSLGIRGDSSTDQIAKAEQHLQQWLSDNADRYEVAGKLRVLGYNSPFLPAARRYAEVQVPVKSKTPQEP